MMTLYVSIAIIVIAVITAIIILLNNSSTTADDNRVVPATEAEADSPTPTSTGSVNATASGWSGAGWIVALLLVVLIGGGSWWGFQRSATLRLSPQEIAAQKEDQRLLTQGWQKSTTILKYSGTTPEGNVFLLVVKFPAKMARKNIIFKDFRFVRLFKLNEHGKYIPLEDNHAPSSFYIPGKLYPKEDGVWGAFQLEEPVKVPIKIFWRQR